MASRSTLLGAAGEHHVMTELLRPGYIAALAPQGVPNADIVVTDIEGSRLCSIQVKARRVIGSDGGWHMKAKHEGTHGKRLFYCLVDFGRVPTDRPRLHVLPSSVVADVLAATHSQWLATPGENGRAHEDGSMRRLVPDYSGVYRGAECPYPKVWLEQYRDAWQLQSLEPTAVERESQSEFEDGP